MRGNTVRHCGECPAHGGGPAEAAWHLREATRQERAYLGAVSRNLSAIDKLTDRQIRDTVSLLRAAKLRINAAINEIPAGSFQAFYLPELKAEVARIFEEFQTQYKAEFQRLQIDIQDLGTKLVQEPLAKLGFNMTFPSLPSNITQALATFHADQIVAISNEAIAKISTQLSLGLLSPDPKPGALVKAIAKLLPSPASSGTIAGRAKTIIRTEVGRIHAYSTQARMEQAVEVAPGLRKYWLPAYRNTRPSHLAAGRDYDEANAIPVNEPFYIGGFPAMYPRDPALPAEEVVNCSCASVPTVLDVEPPGGYVA